MPLKVSASFSLQHATISGPNLEVRHLFSPRMTWLNQLLIWDKSASPLEQLGNKCAGASLTPGLEKLQTAMFTCTAHLLLLKTCRSSTQHHTPHYAQERFLLIKPAKLSNRKIQYVMSLNRSLQWIKEYLFISDSFLTLIDFVSINNYLTQFLNYRNYLKFHFFYVFSRNFNTFLIHTFSFLWAHTGK